MCSLGHLRELRSQHKLMSQEKGKCRGTWPRPTCLEQKPPEHELGGGPLSGNFGALLEDERGQLESETVTLQAPPHGCFTLPWV